MSSAHHELVGYLFECRQTDRQVCSKPSFSKPCVRLRPAMPRDLTKASILPLFSFNSMACSIIEATGKWRLQYCNGVSQVNRARVFIGPIFYQFGRWHKVHSHACGPVAMLTRQTLEGRSRNGGLRMGEMERRLTHYPRMCKFLCAIGSLSTRISIVSIFANDVDWLRKPIWIKQPMRAVAQWVWSARHKSLNAANILLQESNSMCIQTRCTPRTTKQETIATVDDTSLFECFRIYSYFCSHYCSSKRITTRRDAADFFGKQ